MKAATNKIAVLAPNIPSLSATFVYNEIFALERAGFDVSPVSVHADHGTDDSRLNRLQSRTYYLYATPLLAKLQSVAIFSQRHPLRTFRLTATLLGDMARLFRELSVRRAGHEAPRLVYQWLTGLALAGYLQKRGCLHLHIHFAHVPARIGMYAALAAGIPFTVTAHANDLFERGLLIQRIAARARRFLTVSEFNRRWLSAHGVAPEKVGLVRCSVTTPQTKSDLRAMNHGRGLVVLGSLGRLVPKKGMDVLIRALAESPEVRLELAGDGPEREYLRALARTHAPGRVRFLGALPHARVRDWMSCLDGFVLACRRDASGDMDGIPVVLMEAMSCGVPVVSTRISGIPELVEHEVTGLLAEPDSPGAFARQINTLRSHPRLITELSRRAYERVTGEFGVRRNTKRLIQYIQEEQSSERA